MIPCWYNSERGRFPGRWLLKPQRSLGWRLNSQLTGVGDRGLTEEKRAGGGVLWACVQAPLTRIESTQFLLYSCLLGTGAFSLLPLSPPVRDEAQWSDGADPHLDLPASRALRKRLLEQSTRSPVFSEAAPNALR